MSSRMIDKGLKSDNKSDGSLPGNTSSKIRNGYDYENSSDSVKNNLKSKSNTSNQSVESLPKRMSANSMSESESFDTSLHMECAGIDENNCANSTVEGVCSGTKCDGQPNCTANSFENTCDSITLEKSAGAVTGCPLNNDATTHLEHDLKPEDNNHEVKGKNNVNEAISQTTEVRNKGIFVLSSERNKSSTATAGSVNKGQAKQSMAQKGSKIFDCSNSSETSQQRLENNAYKMEEIKYINTKVDADVTITGVSLKGKMAFSMRGNGDTFGGKAEFKKPSKMEMTLRNGGLQPKELQSLTPLASFLCEIGLQNTRERAYKDLIRMEEKKKNAANERGKPSIDKSHKNMMEQLNAKFDDVAKKNDSFRLAIQICAACGFQSESANVMEWHTEYGHSTPDGSRACAYCNFSTKAGNEFTFHMEAEHNRVGRVQASRALFECPFCVFETRQNNAFRKHYDKCRRGFEAKRHLEPSQADSDVPIKKLRAELPSSASKPLSVFQPPAILQSQQQKKLQPAKFPVFTGGKLPNVPVSIAVCNGIAAPVMAQPNRFPLQPQNLLNTSLAAAGAQQGGGVPPRLIQIGNQMFSMVVNNGYTCLQPWPGGRGMGSAQGVASPLPTVCAQAVRNSGLPPAPDISTLNPLQNPFAFGNAVTSPMCNVPSMPPQFSANVYSVSGTQAKPATISANSAVQDSSTVPSTATSDNYVIGTQKKVLTCEICGGFLNDRESLRIHFFWSHKLDIPKKTFDLWQLPVICDVCPERFWTEMGLFRHGKFAHPCPEVNNSSSSGGRSKKPRNGGIATPPQTVMAAASPPATYTCSICSTKHIRYVLTHLKFRHGIDVETVLGMLQCPCCGKKLSTAEAVLSHVRANHEELLTDPAMSQLLEAKKNSAAHGSKTIPVSSGPATSPSKSERSATIAPIPTGLFVNKASNKESKKTSSEGALDYSVEETKVVDSKVSTPDSKVSTPATPLASAEPPVSNATPVLKPHVASAISKFACVSCDKEFTTKALLKAHRTKMHSILCALCDCTFPSIDEMQRHTKKIHKNDKQPCDICAEKFISGRHRLRHVKAPDVRTSLTRLSTSCTTKHRSPMSGKTVQKSSALNTNKNADSAIEIID